MKNGTLRSLARRAVSVLLSAAVILPLAALEAPKAEALRVQPGQNITTTTNLVIWDWIDDMQAIGKDADVSNPEAKYSRIMFYHNTGGERYYFNAAPDGGSKSGDGYTTYYANKIYLDNSSRIGNSVHREWNQDLIDGSHFVTVGGVRTPYIQWHQITEGYHDWRLWTANQDDSLSDYTLLLEDDYEDLNVRRTYGGYSDAHSFYGAKNNRIRSDGWIIAKTAHIAPQSRWANYDYHVLWHWDNDTGGYDEALEFDRGDQKFRAWNIDTGGCDEFRIFLGTEHAVPTLSENFTVQADQITTLGRPLYYIPKGVTLTVENEGVLSVDGMLLNDGEIVVKDGGLLILKDGAKVMPLTKYDNDCGKITSSGSVVVEEDALLCGGALNGIRILGGGVVNYGILAAEDFYVSENYAIENRGDGWVFAGQSPTRAARLRYIMEAVANEGVTKVADPRADFGKIGSVKSSYNIPANGIYGDAAANVVKSGEEAVGAPDDPTITVYVKDRPDDQKDETLFRDVKLDKVNLRVDGEKATYTADGKTYTIQNKLVSATIGRGGSGSEVLFKDMWVGALDGAWVQLEPDNASGYRLALANGSADNGAGVILGKADDNMDKWWRISKAGTVGGDVTYYIDNCKSTGEARGLDISGADDDVSDGSAVCLYQHDGGNDQKWIIVPVGSNFNIQNAANRNVSLAARGAQVYVRTNSTYAASQRWNMVNLFSEDAYADSVAQGTALEMIPQSAPDKRLTVSVTERTLGIANTGTVSIEAPADGGLNQRWRLEPVGTDDLDGASTVFYRIVETDSGLALEPNNGVTSGAVLAAQRTKSGSYGSGQYWYLQEVGADTYYVAARSNSSLVLTAGSSGLTLGINSKASSQIWKISGVTNAKEESERAAAEAKNDPFAGRVFEMEPSDMSGWRLAARTTSNSQVEFRENISGKENAKWQFVRLGSDTLNGQEQSYYQIVPETPEATGMALGRYMLYSTSEDQQPVYQVNFKADDKSQQWYITENEDGTYTITLRDNPALTLGREWGKAWNSYQAAMTAGHSEKDTSTRYVEYKYEYDPIAWNLIEIVKDELDGRTFMISPASEDSFYLGANQDRSGKKPVDSPSGVLYCYDDIAGANTSKWTFRKLGTDTFNGEQAAYYQIVSVDGDVALGVDGNRLYGNVKLVQRTVDANETGQQWFVTTNDDGTCTFTLRAEPELKMHLYEAEINGVIYRAGELKKDAEDDGIYWKLSDPGNIDFLDGRVFCLSPKHAADKTLDLVGNGTGNGTQVQLYDRVETEIQRWKFERLGSDYQNGKKVNYYAIHSVYSPTRALDIPGGSTSNGTRPQLYDYNATNKNQQWILEDAGSGYYRIIPRSDTTKSLSCASGGTGNNTAVVLWEQEESDSQKWKLSETIVPETMGTYELESAGGSGFTIDVSGNSNDSGAALVLYAAHAGEHTRWTFKKMGVDRMGAYYQIINKASGKAMDLAGIDAAAENASVLQATYDFHNDQLWYLNKAGSDDRGDFYYIVNRNNSDLRIAVKDSNYQNSQSIVVTSGTGDNAKWRLNEDFEPVELGIYEFGSMKGVSMRMEVVGASTAGGANVQLFHRNGTTSSDARHMQWKLVQRGNDMIDGVTTPYYSIENVNSGMTVDPIQAGVASSGLNIQQYGYDGYSDQHWYLEVQDDSSVMFRNRANRDVALAVSGDTDGANVNLYTYVKGAPEECWQLHPVMMTQTVETSKGSGSSVRYYIPGNQAAADAGIPFMRAENEYLNPEVGGNYTLTPMHASGLRMDLAGADTSNGSKLQTYTNNGGAAQRWQFIPMGVDFFDGDGRMYYRIAYGANAGKVVETSGYGPVTANLNAQMWDYDGAYDQFWYLEKASAGESSDAVYYLIGRGTMSKADKICLGVPGGATTSSTQLQTSTLRNKNYQQWELEPVD